MDITFDRGNDNSPKGHALIYFRNSLNQEEIWITYVVILPVTVDVSKYVPPFLMNQVSEVGPKDLSAFAFPPAPEQLGNYENLKKMADSREDDILFGGTIDPADVPSSMMLVGEIVQTYAQMYSDLTQQDIKPNLEHNSEPSGLDVNAVVYSLMGDSDKLAELTKLVGRLRYAVDGSEDDLVSETERDIKLLSSHLPENHYVPELVSAVKSSNNQGEQLADLYLQHCFHLVQEEYGKLGDIEKQIHSLEDNVAQT